MQTALADFVKDTELGIEANDILRSCVHCGFCLATCPTYKLLGSELDSPRGRIYLIKQVLEGKEVTAKTQLHLDRCLTCRNCETTCPSGVQYGRLLDAGRYLVEQQVERKLPQRLTRWALRTFVAHDRRIAPVVKLGRLARPILPDSLKRHVPEAQNPGPWPVARHARKMLVLQGCVQPSLAPRINAASARVLDQLGISLIEAKGAGCCGAISHHLAAHDEGIGFMRRNIDAWWPHVEGDVEAIVMTASGCGAMLREYGHVLRHDPSYAEKAQRITGLTRDISEVLADEDLAPLSREHAQRKIAFHPPCTLQHGQKLPNVVERILESLGFALTPIPDKHLCCGSAGTYSILQKQLSETLLEQKIEALESGAPEIIATANIGCLLHLRSKSQRPVQHWIELLDSKG